MNTLKGNFDTLQEKVMASRQKSGIFRFQSQILGSKTQLILIKIILPKNFELDLQLSVKTFFAQDLFEKFYLVKMCPKFDGTPLVLFTIHDHFLLGC